MPPPSDGSKNLALIVLGSV